MFCQGFDDFSQCATLEPSLLCSSPPIRSTGSASLSGCSQVFADMKEIAQEDSLRPEHFTRLQPDPFRSIPDRVDVAVQPPTGTAGTMAPPPSHLSDFAKGGTIKDLIFALSLRGRQSYFFPVPRPFAIPFPGRHSANHRSIRFSHHVLGSHQRQDAKGF